ncbi:MAG: hypothetical protein M3P26_10560 [Gemmatimonadota bacterium]|nr:hypothetical protein [Gemmatimonadota bacterium]
MANQIEFTGSKWLLFLAAVAVLLAAIGRLVVQPLFSAWIFLTIEKEPAKMRGLVEQAFQPQIDELVKSAREIRECQAEQGEQIAYIAGQLRGIGRTYQSPG